MSKQFRKGHHVVTTKDIITKTKRVIPKGTLMVYDCGIQGMQIFYCKEYGTIITEDRVFESLELGDYSLILQAKYLKRRAEHWLAKKRLEREMKKDKSDEYHQWTGRMLEKEEEIKKQKENNQ